MSNLYPSPNDWRSIALGVALAALLGGLQYAGALPSPWGPIAAAVSVVLATFLTPKRLP